MIVTLIVAAEVALLLFALAPQRLHALCMFANGLSLGLVFGLVLGFLEGRRVTEALIAGLCASFILADGIMKSVGTWLLEPGCERALDARAGGARSSYPRCSSSCGCSRGFRSPAAKTSRCAASGR